MVKNSFISVISQKENTENSGFVEFQVFTFTTKISKLKSHLELHKKKLYLRERFAENFGKMSTATGLFVKKNRERYKELIGELDIREIKTR